MPMQKVGKKARKWMKFRQEWKKTHAPNDEGYYECYLCGKWLKPSQITLDHVIPRSHAPALAFNEDNIRVACWDCNLLKGSKSLENYKKDLNKS